MWSFGNILKFFMKKISFLWTHTNLNFNEKVTFRRNISRMKWTDLMTFPGCPAPTKEPVPGIGPSLLQAAHKQKVCKGKTDVITSGKIPQNKLSHCWGSGYSKQQITGWCWCAAWLSWVCCCCLVSHLRRSSCCGATLQLPANCRDGGKRRPCPQTWWQWSAKQPMGVKGDLHNYRQWTV